MNLRSAARASSVSGRSCARERRLRRLTNAEIAKNPHYGDFSLEQSQLSVEDFYDRMDDVMSPEPLDPVSAMQDAITSLEEQVKTRVTSVENGRKFQTSGRGDATCRTARRSSRPTARGRISPRRRAIFALLIAIDVVRGFPDHVARQPDRYAHAARKSVARREGRNCRACWRRSWRRASSPIRAATARNGRSRSKT